MASAPISADDDADSPDLSEQLQSAQLGDPDYIGDHESSLYHQQHAKRSAALQQRHGADSKGAKISTCVQAAGEDHSS